jgi:epoxyqueuosine reductase
MNIKSKIIEFGKSIGIDYIGFSDVEFNDEFYKSIRQRRENGHLSGFEESDENIRINTRTLLPEVNTLISIIVPYRTIEVNKDKPYFSKASLGLDYHKIVKEKLELLSSFLYNNFRAKCECYCDIGPLSDREIAKKCGLGFYGKNTNIITKKYGSFVFLGEILTDIYIDRDSELETNCGECELCIKACPVGAIEKPYYINAKKCLSYVGQKKDELSDDEINSLGNRIYGCDTCQDVCPYNSIKEISTIPEFYPEEWNYNLNEEYILNMSNKDFKEKFGKTSSGWRGNKILKRNLIIAMGNSKNKNYLQILKKQKDKGLEYYVNKAIMKVESECSEEG